VFNVTVNAIAGGVAFILSFLIGIISGSTFFIILIRALFCGAGFFVLAWGAQALVSRFLPELLNEEGEGGPGSQVDITVEDAGIVRGEPPLAAGLDQNAENAYTKREVVAEQAAPADFVPVSPVRPAQSAANPVDTLPNHESMEGTFHQDDDHYETEGVSEAPILKKSRGTGKVEDLVKVDPKIMAAAIQTILKR
jgi:hypothetical protein